MRAHSFLVGSSRLYLDRMSSDDSGNINLAASESNHSPKKQFHSKLKDESSKIGKEASRLGKKSWTPKVTEPKVNNGDKDASSKEDKQNFLRLTTPQSSGGAYRESGMDKVAPDNFCPWK